MKAQGDLLTWAEAIRKGETGMQQAADHAERVDPGWSDVAFAALAAFAPTVDDFTAEEARHAAHGQGVPLPPDGRAWGAVFKRAAKMKIIHKNGIAPRRCGNMTPTIVWSARDE